MNEPQDTALFDSLALVYSHARRISRALFPERIFTVALLVCTVSLFSPFTFAADKFFSTLDAAGVACHADYPGTSSADPTGCDLYIWGTTDTRCASWYAGLYQGYSRVTGVIDRYLACNSGCPTGSVVIGTSCYLQPVAESPKDLGPPKCGKGVLNPCDASSGNKYQADVDYSSADGSLRYARHYNSLGARPSGQGYNWTVEGTTWLAVNGTAIQMLGGDARVENFTCPSGTGACTGDADTKLRLTKDASGYTLTYRDGASSRHNTGGVMQYATDRNGRRTTHTRNGSGYLVSKTGPYGHQIILNWNFTAPTLTSITLPGGQLVRYMYASTVRGYNVTRVDYPDGSAKIYHYEDARFPNSLTGISFVESNGTVTRYANYAYDFQGKAILTEHLGGPKATLTYNSATQTTVTDGTNTAEVLTFAKTLNVKNLTSKLNQADGKSLKQTFDARNNLTCRKDEEGRVTTYAYNGTNQKNSMTEGLVGDCTNPIATSATRTTTYQYLSPTLDLPTAITSPSVNSGSSKTVTLGYGDSAHPNLPTSITQSGFTPAGTPVARSISMTYNANGQVASINGPRTDVNDVTVFAYNNCTTGDACGQLQSITNALGQTTSYDTYDVAGRVTQMTDPNGLRTNYTYDARGRVIGQAQTPPSGFSRTTTFAYNAAGNVTSVATPDGLVLNYTYSAAQLLSRVADNRGNRVDYAYDANGNRTGEGVYDQSGNLVQQIATLYDIRNRVAWVNAGGSYTQQLHDAIGNLVQVTDPNQAVALNSLHTTHEYDALNRLFQTVDNLSGQTTYAYDANDRIRQVSVPNGATTQYVYDDLGNLLSESSPDRGALNYTYDAAGNATSMTDGRGVQAAYSYDLLNRLVAIDYPGTQEDAVFVYDSAAGCAFGIGRLCTVLGSTTTTYSYTAFGEVVEKRQTESAQTLVVSYAYDSAGKLSAITYPSGIVVSYAYAGGQATSVALNAANVLANVTRQAFGAITGWTWGNGQTHARAYDLAGRVTSLQWPDGVQSLYYDANGNPLENANATEAFGFGYDALDRVTSAGLLNPGGGGTPTSVAPFIFPPAVLTQIQGMANESLTPPQTVSRPWLTSRSDFLTSSGFSIALERSQVSPGTVNSNEAIGYVAFQAGQLGVFNDNAGQPVGYQTFALDPQFVGWDDGCRSFNMSLSGATTPVLLASLTTRLGADGGWLRRCGVSGTSASLVVDEDKYYDAERNHVVEAAGAVAFTRPFHATFTDPVGNPWSMEAGAVVTFDTSVTPVFTAVTFQQPFAVAPVVITLPGNEGADPVATRIRNVTPYGFQVAQVEPDGIDGRHISVTVHYLAVEAGVHALPDGTRVAVGTVGTQAQQASTNVPITSTWAQVSFPGFQIPGSPTPTQYGYGYDANGNRLQSTIDTQTTLINYVSGTNRMASDNQGVWTLDAAGNVVADSQGRSYAYDNDGRLVQLTANGIATTYTYSERRQRVRKTTQGGTVAYAYDESGRLIGEYDPNGVALTEYVYLEDIPVALNRDGQIYYTSSDHLGTPRRVANSQGTVVWRWNPSGFGEVAPDEDPDQNGTPLVVNLRFAGQYYDGESGLFYNWNRYYDPRIGRYLTSDPIGLGGGLNTYVYVANNPLKFVDPTGLLFLTHLNEFSRDPIPRQDAVRISNFTNAVTLTGVTAATAGTAAVSMGPSAARFAVTQTQLAILRNPVAVEQGLAIGTAALVQGPPDLSNPASLVGFFLTTNPRDVARTIVTNMLAVHGMAVERLADFMFNTDQWLRGCPVE